MKDPRSTASHLNCVDEKDVKDIGLGYLAASFSVPKRMGMLIALLQYFA